MNLFFKNIIPTSRILKNTYIIKKRNNFYMKIYEKIAIYTNNNKMLLNVGYYYNDIKYYERSIENGCIEGYKYLGYYYQQKKNFIEMRKNYLLSIKNKDYDGLLCLGYYYQIEENNIDKAKKYYNHALKKNNYLAYSFLGLSEENEDKKIYYYNKAINNMNDDFALNEMGCYYFHKKDYDNMKLCFIKANKNNTALLNLGDFYRLQENYEKMFKYYKKINGKLYMDVEEKQQIDKYYRMKYIKRVIIYSSLISFIIYDSYNF
jgi:tetratricopeptide (TPR) repeat protein